MRTLVLILFSAFSISLLAGCDAQSPGASSNDASYERIIKSQKMRVGYISYPPSFIVEPNTKKLSGISHDILQKAAENLGIELEFSEEVAWSSMIEAVDARRVDIIGTSIWPTAARGKRADFVTPSFFSHVKAYVRADDNRFDGNIAAANAEGIRIAVIDGEIASSIAMSDFPKAQRVSLTQVSDVTQLLLEVASKKADITFVEPAIALAYANSNPNTIKEVANVKPLRLFPNSFMIKKGEYKLKGMMDVAVDELVNTGFVEQVLEKYEEFPGSFGRVAAPSQP